MLFRSPLRLLLIGALGLAVMPAPAQATHGSSWTYFDDANSYRYDLYGYYWYINDGTRNAYDQFGRTTINGTGWTSICCYRPYTIREFPNRANWQDQTPSRGGGARADKAYRVGNFDVWPHIWIPPNGHADARNYARHLWSIRNRSGSPQNLNFRWYGNLGSNGNTRITRTSDGNTSWSVSDDWVATDDHSNGGGTPSLAFVYRNSGGRAPSRVQRSGDNLYFDWNSYRVAGNATATFVFFTVQDANQAASHREAARITTMPAEVLR